MKLPFYDKKKQPVCSGDVALKKEIKELKTDFLSGVACKASRSRKHIHQGQSWVLVMKGLFLNTIN